MKRIKYKTLISRATLQGMALGLVVAIIIILLSMDSSALVSSGEVTIKRLFSVFPGIWAVIFLPFIFAFASYWISKKFASIIKRQAGRLRREAGRTKMVLSFIENLRQDKLEEPLDDDDKEDSLTNALINLREYMIKSKHEQERRRLEEEQRN